jgi:hypothetical protein
VPRLTLGLGERCLRRSACNALYRRAQRLTSSYRSAYVLATSENSSTTPSSNPSVTRRWWSLIISTCSGAILRTVLPEG